MYKYYNTIIKTVKQMQFRKLYYFPGLSFEVYCDSLDLFYKVDKFLYPHMLTEKKNCEQEWKIYYIRGNIKIEQLRVEKIIGTYGNDSLVTASFSEDNGVYYYYNSESSNETIVNPRESEAFVVYASDIIDLNLLEDCYAIIRTICFSHLCLRGAILIHGCAVKYDNKTILLVGEKGAGKTTVQHYLLNELKTDFISADRTIVWIDNGQAVCTGWISTYRPDISIFELLPKSEDMEKLKEYYRCRKDDMLYFQKNKIRIAPGELIEMLCINALSISQIDSVVILDDLGAGDVYALEKIDVDSAEALCARFIIDLKKHGVDLLIRYDGCECIQLLDTLAQFVKVGVKFYRLIGRGRLDEIKSLFIKL